MEKYSTSIGPSRAGGRIIETATRLFGRRWSVPVVATLYREGPLRVSALQARLGASSDTLQETLAGLRAHGILVREGPRGAFSLTEHGRELGDVCNDAVVAVRESGLVSLALRKWPMFVLVAASRGGSRFANLMAMLPGITPRALAMALKELEREGLVERTIAETYPPSVAYRLAPRGWELVSPMEALVAACERLPPRAGPAPTST